jgi:hemolysin activation/secretion protein
VTRGYADSGEERSNFVKYNLSAVRQRALNRGEMVTLRLDVQLSPDRNLPTVEQLSLGGMSSVRGYPNGTRMGDRGYFVSAEWSRPLSETVTGFLFLDHGGALPYKGNNQSNNSDDFLTSTGLGMTVKFDDRNSAKLVLGIPLQHAAEYSPRVHFVWQSLL